MKALVFFCLISASCLAQQRPEILKKNKVNKITITQQHDTGDPIVMIRFYDANGNDTATVYGQRYEYVDYEYDASNKILKKHVFWASGEPKEDAVYTYQKDGSYSVEDKDSQFGLVKKSWYDKNGFLVKLQIPDGSVYTFTNDSKGNALKTVITRTGEKTQVSTSAYTYDKSGNVLQEKKSNGTIVQNKYNEKGLLIESAMTFKTDGEPEKYTYTYKYE